MSRHSLKTEAIKEGQRIAKKNAPSRLTAKRQDGTIEFEYTYGDDPYPPVGRKAK